MNNEREFFLSLKIEEGTTELRQLIEEEGTLKIEFNITLEDIYEYIEGNRFFLKTFIMKEVDNE